MVIAVFGANGRVGKQTVKAATERGHCVYGIDADGAYLYQAKAHSQCADNAAPIKAIKTDDGLVDTEIDAVIDYSTASATQQVCEFCLKHRCALVSGVTGRNDEQTQLVKQLSASVPVVCKANFSTGIAALTEICRQLALMLPDWDCEIVEIHRREKTDAPSGTAKQLAATLAQRKSFTQTAVHSLRAGSNFGCHCVVLASKGESLTLTHQAENVDIFAYGAVKQAEKTVAERLAKQN